MRSPRMKIPAVYLAAMVLAALPPTSVQAQEKAMPERGPIPFEAYDLDGDGFVTEMEYTETHNKRIQERAEAGYPMRGMQERGVASFAAFDGDGDGKLTREELEAGQTERWEEQRMQRREDMRQRGSGPRSGARGRGRGADQ